MGTQRHMCCMPSCSFLSKIFSGIISNLCGILQGMPELSHSKLNIPNWLLLSQVGAALHSSANYYLYYSSQIYSLVF